MPSFQEYICNQIEAKLRDRKIVVIYDEREDFLPLFDRDLHNPAIDNSNIHKILIGETQTMLARFRGSFFELLALFEPFVKIDDPDPLVVYVPGVPRDRQTSPLMEIEKAGTCYEPQLKRLALNVLRKRFTEGQIDEMLKPANLKYDDIAGYLEQGELGNSASILRSVFASTQSDSLLASWLASTDHDSTIEEKDASQELFSLVESNLGLKINAKTPIKEARNKTIRYVLVNEFRSDLEGEEPACISMIEEAPGVDEIARIKIVTKSLRDGYGVQYNEIATKVETDLRLEASGVNPAHLGSIDTFRFEERALLKLAGDLIGSKKYTDARRIVSNRARSFWIDRDVNRQAQWEACRLMADLGYEIERVRSKLSVVNGKPEKWINAYAEDKGWYLVDSLQRHLETWVAKMDEEPETEQAFAVVKLVLASI